MSHKLSCVHKLTGWAARVAPLAIQPMACFAMCFYMKPRASTPLIGLLEMFVSSTVTSCKLTSCALPDLVPSQY